MKVYLVLALLPPWTWDPVTANCKGGSESAVVYMLSQVLVEPAGFVRRCYTEPETGGEVCQDDIVYAPALFVREDETALTEFPDAEVYVPPRGGVTFLEVEARDEAGNVSGGLCE